MFHKVRSVAPLPEHRLLLHFADGSARQYDMAPLFERVHVFRALLAEPALFEQVRVDPGGYGISWNDDLDLDAGELWENGKPVQTPFVRLLSFGEATALWGLSESALRQAVRYRKLAVGLDVQKFGKQWIVTSDAMEREYGPAPAAAP